MELPPLATMMLAQESTAGTILFWVIAGLIAVLWLGGWLLIKYRPKTGFLAKLYRLAKKVKTKLTGTVDLSDEPVKSLKLEVAGRLGIYPGGTATLVATCELENGQVEKSQGEGKGRIAWKDLPATVEGATAQDGVLTLAEDPRTAPASVKVKVGLAGHPENVAELVIPVHYAGEYVARFSGRPGRPGVQGDPGTHGNHRGRAADGTRGRDGGDGGAGSDGGKVQVTVALAEGSLLQLRVSGAPYEDKFYLVDPKGGKLTVLARGGQGGPGGSGGWGGGGGTGGGNGGDGGDGGDGADGGNGGSITLTAAPEARPHLEIITLDNSGGDGGGAGSGGPGGGGGQTDGEGQTHGRVGAAGRSGQRSGCAGRPGPKPEIRIQPVRRIW